MGFVASPVWKQLYEKAWQYLIRMRNWGEGGGFWQGSVCSTAEETWKPVNFSGCVKECLVCFPPHLLGGFQNPHLLFRPDPEVQSRICDSLFFTVFLSFCQTASPPPHRGYFHPVLSVHQQIGISHVTCTGTRCTSFA